MNPLVDPFLRHPEKVRNLGDVELLRKVTEQLIGMLEKTATNEEFVARLKGWMNVYEKDGYTSGRSFMK